MLFFELCIIMIFSKYQEDRRGVNCFEVGPWSSTDKRAGMYKVCTATSDSTW